MLKRKDPTAFLAPFVPLAPLIRAVDLGDQGHAPHVIRAAAKALGLETWSNERSDEELNASLNQRVKTRLVTGSHQTVALHSPLS